MSLNKLAIKYPLSLVILLIVLSVDVLSQTNISSLKKQKEQNEKDIAYTSKLIDNTIKNKNVSIGRLTLLNQRIKSRYLLISSIENEISYIGVQIAQLNKDIQTLESELDKLKKQYAKVIVYAQKQRNSFEKLMFLLSSKDFNQAYKRYKYLQQFSEYSRKQGKSIEAKKDSLAVKISELNKVKKEKQILLTQKTEENNKLSEEKSQQAELVDSLKQKEKQLKDELQKQKKYAEKLQKEIQKIIEEQAKLAKKTNNSSGKYDLTPEDKSLSQSFGNNKGKLPWPTKTGFISENFGEHPHPVLKHVTVRNDGISITTDSKSECRSIFKGEVTHILSMPGLNNVVIIRHGEFFSVYSNLASVDVKKGDEVQSKDKIGIVYTDNSQDHTVLKFQLWKGSTKLNPAQWLYHN
jgi:septal ring factor EnvC (AmiA/AmiB activator)